jgi:hypothetical protein
MGLSLSLVSFRTSSDSFGGVVSSDVSSCLSRARSSATRLCLAGKQGQVQIGTDPIYLTLWSGIFFGADTLYYNNNSLPVSLFTYNI